MTGLLYWMVGSAKLQFAHLKAPTRYYHRGCDNPFLSGKLPHLHRLYKAGPHPCHLIFVRLALHCRMMEIGRERELSYGMSQVVHHAKGPLCVHEQFPTPAQLSS